MKKHLIYSLCCMYCTPTWCASLLQAQHFPKSYSDVSFTDRAEIQHDGYKPYFELNAYDQLILTTNEDIAHDAIEQVLRQNGICDQAPTDDPTDVCGDPDSPDVPQPSQPSQSQPPQSQQPPQSDDTPESPTAPQRPPSKSTSTSGYCSKTNPAILTGQKIPFGLPINTNDLNINSLSARAKSIVNYTNRGIFCDGYGCREKGGGVTRPHTGTDIGCDAAFHQMPIYTTADGVVELVIHADDDNFESAGNYIRINHGNGFITQYMHLDEILVNRGDTVSAGCMIGTMGHTGGNADQEKPSMDIDLTHLHYEIIYSGQNRSFTAPNGKTVTVKRGESCSNKQTFRNKIDPADFMIYK